MYFLFIANIIALLFSFFVAGALLGALFSHEIREKIAHALRLDHLILNRSRRNPILRPGTHPWTAEAVLNPAALILGGRTHLVYRAVGVDGVSRLGYASSPDGITFDNRVPYPVYVATSSSSLPKNARHYSPVMYPSGGSWGGCEDPRMVAIDGRVYVTFNMFQDWMLRVGVISMSEGDFLAHRFYTWEKPIVLSHSERDKNWVLFPEKIGGRFAVLHSIIGPDEHHVRIEYADDLEELALRNFKSPDPQKIPDKRIAWHLHTRSAGPPPLKTDRGWLVFYHANDHEGYKYKLGAMLLDLVDPTKIIARAQAPVLSPDELYENHGKPGIVYAGGAVVHNGKLFVYYGGADKVICVATASLDDFLNELIAGSQPSLAHLTLAQAT